MADEVGRAYAVSILQSVVFMDVVKVRPVGQRERGRLVSCVAS